MNDNFKLIENEVTVGVGVGFVVVIVDIVDNNFSCHFGMVLLGKLENRNQYFGSTSPHNEVVVVPLG